jgi:hypothetical protein
VQSAVGSRSDMLVAAGKLRQPDTLDRKSKQSLTLGRLRTTDTEADRKSVRPDKRFAGSTRELERGPKPPEVAR